MTFLHPRRTLDFRNKGCHFTTSPIESQLLLPFLCYSFSLLLGCLTTTTNEAQDKEDKQNDGHLLQEAEKPSQLPEGPVVKGTAWLRILMCFWRRIFAWLVGYMLMKYAMWSYHKVLRSWMWLICPEPMQSLTWSSYYIGNLGMSSNRTLDRCKNIWRLHCMFLPSLLH